LLLGKALLQGKAPYLTLFPGKKPYDASEMQRKKSRTRPGAALEITAET